MHTLIWISVQRGRLHFRPVRAGVTIGIERAHRTSHEALT